MGFKVTNNLLRLATRHGHHEASGWFAVLTLLLIVVVVALAGVAIATLAS